MFDDTVGLENVIKLLKDYGSLVEDDLTPAQLDTLRGNSPLPFLARELRQALQKSGIDASDLADANAVMHSSFRIGSGRFNNLQEAQINALFTVLSAQDPDDWDPDRLKRFETELKTIHAIQGDIAREEATKSRAFRRGRRKGAVSENQKIIRALLKKKPNADTNKLWYQFDKEPGKTAKAKKLQRKSFAVEVSRARKALGLKKK